MSEFLCQDLGASQHYLLILGVALIEAWLGKTNKTKSGSMLELIFNVLAALWSRLRGKNGNA